jgi:hypothetical protein
MHPRVRMRGRHPTERSLHLLKRRLLHGGQDEEPCVGRRGERPGVRRRVAAARAGLPITGTALQLDHKRRLDRRQPCQTFRFRQTGHRTSTPSTRGDFLIAWHRHLPPSMRDLRERRHHKP